MLWTLVLLLIPFKLNSQVVPDAFEGNPSLWGGFEFANYKAAFPYGSGLRLSGPGAFVTFNWTHHIGFEGHARFLDLNSWNGETEQDYIAGPRYTFFMSRHWRPFVTVGVGGVRIHYPFSIGTGNQFAVAPGGGLEYRITRRVSVRGVYEFQYLPNSPNFSNEPHFGMDPNGVYGGFSIRAF